MKINRIHARINQYTTCQDLGPADGGVADPDAKVRIRRAGHTRNSETNNGRNPYAAFYFERSDGERFRCMNTVSNVLCLRPTARSAGIVKNIGACGHDCDETLYNRSLVIYRYRITGPCCR